MHIQDRIKLLVKLGEYMFSKNERWEKCKMDSSYQNNWFTLPHIESAVDAIATQYLDSDVLHTFTQHIAEPSHRKIVGIVMAGNIPLVGFHDLLCVFLSGHNALIKLSSKDNVLLPHLLEVLISWNTEIADCIQTAERLKDCDAYIATGSNTSAGYFEYYFSKKPHIIRKNKTSVAIIDGNETSEELAQLATDVFTYFGLGCRNVTHLYVPQNYNFEPLLETFKHYSDLMMHSGYANNYDYQLAIQIINGQHYMTNGNILFMENEAIYSPISVLNYSYYDDNNELIKRINNNNDIQCVVGRGFIPFGQAQCPSITDFADGIDTISFLSRL